MRLIRLLTPFVKIAGSGMLTVGSSPSSEVMVRFALMAPVDLILIEGFKQEHHDKIEIHRPAFGRSLLCTDDPRVVAVASDTPLEGIPVPCLDLNDPGAIAGFVIAHCGLNGWERRG